MFADFGLTILLLWGYIFVVAIRKCKSSRKFEDLMLPKMERNSRQQPLLEALIVLLRAEHSQCLSELELDGSNVRLQVELKLRINHLMNSNSSTGQKRE